jgi:hypothetical protein
MKKLILSLAVVAFIAVGTVSVSASTLTQDPQKKEVKKATKAADKKACADTKKECCDTKKTTKKKKKKK